MNLSIQNSMSNFSLLNTTSLIRNLNFIRSINATTLFRRSHVCTMCDVIFFKKFNLKKHINQFHIRIMFFRCDICDFTFERKNRLSKHFKIHIKNFDFVFDKITKNWANHTFSTTFYFQYLTNSIIRKLFEQFITIYDRIFSKTLCFHCEKLFIDIDVKWVNYDAKINYYFWT